MHSKFFILTILLCLKFLHTDAQVIESAAETEKYFAFEVKNIDEFIERFNYEDDAFIVKYLNKNFPAISVDRQSIIANLFNRRGKLGRTRIDSFVAEVNNSLNPGFIEFGSNNWFAEAQCIFDYKGKNVVVNIVLDVQQTENQGVKWMIAGANSKAITPNNFLRMPVAGKYSGRYLNSMSHATNFISLSTAFANRKNIGDYLDQNYSASPYSNGFLNALARKDFKYRYVKKVRYHFLQLDGWIFTVDRYQVNSINSGWLISNLWRASAKEKLVYRQTLLKVRPVGT